MKGNQLEITGDLSSLIPSGDLRGIPAFFAADSVLEMTTS